MPGGIQFVVLVQFEVLVKVQAHVREIDGACSCRLCCGRLCFGLFGVLFGVARLTAGCWGHAGWGGGAGCLVQSSACSSQFGVCAGVTLFVCAD